MNWVIGQARTRDFVTANTFEDAPLLPDRFRVTSSAPQLVSAGKRTSVKEDIAHWIFSENVSRNLQHDCHAEVILLGRIFDIGSGEESGANHIFIEHCAVDLRRQGAAQCALAGAGQSSHKDEHGGPRINEAISCEYSAFSA